jgi:hypothetical protein
VYQSSSRKWPPLRSNFTPIVSTMLTSSASCLLVVLHGEFNICTVLNNRAPIGLHNRAIVPLMLLIHYLKYELLEDTRLLHPDLLHKAANASLHHPPPQTCGVHLFRCAAHPCSHKARHQQMSGISNPCKMQYELVAAGARHARCLPPPATHHAPVISTPRMHCMALQPWDAIIQVHKLLAPGAQVAFTRPTAPALPHTWTHTPTPAQVRKRAIKSTLAMHSLRVVTPACPVAVGMAHMWRRGGSQHSSPGNHGALSLEAQLPWDLLAGIIHVPCASTQVQAAVWQQVLSARCCRPLCCWEAACSICQCCLVSC